MKTFLSVLLGVLMALIVYLYVSLNREQVKNQNNRSEIEEITQKSDSLRVLLGKNEQEYKQLETRLLIRNDSLKKHFENRYSELNKKYTVEKNKIKHLPLTEGVRLLGSNIGTMNSKPAVMVIDMDSNVIITPHHVKVINGAYLSLEDKTLRNELLEQEKDSLRILMNSYGEIMILKDSQISTFKDLNDLNSQSIRELNKKLSEADKLRKKQIFNSILLGGAGGIVIGTLITLL